MNIVLIGYRCSGKITVGWINIMMTHESKGTREDSYFTYFGLYFWRGPPGDLAHGVYQKVTGGLREPVAFFYSPSQNTARLPRVYQWDSMGRLFRMQEVPDAREKAI